MKIGRSGAGAGGEKGYIHPLVVLLLISISLGFATPNFRDLLIKSQVNQFMLDLARHLNFAKHQAIVSQKTITVCAGRENSCTHQWEDGILIFVDYNFDRKINGQDEILRVSEGTDGKDRLIWSSFQNKKTLQFLPTGTTNHQNGTFKFCSATQDPQYHRALVISKLARITLSKDQNGDGIHEDRDGTPIKCDT